MGVPVLFVAGVVFGYFVVLPAATKFLLNFNDRPVQHPDPGERLLQLLHPHAGRDGADLPAADRDPRRHPARDRHPRAALRRTAATRTSSSLIVAMLLPGTDPVTMLIEAVAAAPALRGQRDPGQDVRQTAREPRPIATSPSPSRRPAGRRRRANRVHLGFRRALRPAVTTSPPRGPRRLRRPGADLRDQLRLPRRRHGRRRVQLQRPVRRRRAAAAPPPSTATSSAAQEKLAVEPERHHDARRPWSSSSYSAANANTDSNGAPTSDGVQHLREAADAWNKYVKASKGNLAANAAVYALNTFDLLARIDFSTARTDTSTSEALTDVNAAVDDWKSAAQAQQVLIEKQPNKATSNSYATLAQYLYLSGDTQGRRPGGGAGQGVKGADAGTIDQPAQAGQAARPAAPDGDQAAQQAAAADPGRHGRWRDRRHRRSQPAQRPRHRRQRRQRL